jgi:hypothetical protein
VIATDFGNAISGRNEPMICCEAGSSISPLPGH